MTNQTELCPVCRYPYNSRDHLLGAAGVHRGTGRINVNSMETNPEVTSTEPKNAPKDVSELCPDCGHKLRERTHPLIHCAAPPGRCFCRGWILRKPPKELSEGGLHTTETVADGSIAACLCGLCETGYRPDVARPKHDSPPPDPIIGYDPATGDEHSATVRGRKNEDGSLTITSIEYDSPPPLQESARELRYKAQMLHSFEGGASHWGDELTLSMLAEYASEVACALIAAETARARAEGARAELVQLLGQFRKYSWGHYDPVSIIAARLAALDKQENEK